MRCMYNVFCFVNHAQRCLQAQFSYVMRINVVLAFYYIDLSQFTDLLPSTFTSVKKFVLDCFDVDICVIILMLINSKKDGGGGVIINKNI